ncbi:MAG: hypothetical protein LBQ12_12390 [Deltaproteobacteria bacterium]|jgi:excinuclease ABC subunit A|nr:hypothetical protein [Deltaproteobacteria bacterium]
MKEKLATLAGAGPACIRLGRSAATLSGGEARRVKLSRELSRRVTGRTVCILDEPAAGLHFEDVKKLPDVLQTLTDQGNTFIVIEHDLDVIKCDDHIMDIGPEGGGTTVDESTPEQTLRHLTSFAGVFLRLAQAGYGTPGAALTRSPGTM